MKGLWNRCDRRIVLNLMALAATALSDLLEDDRPDFFAREAALVGLPRQIRLA